MTGFVGGWRARLAGWLGARRDVREIRGMRVLVDNSRPDIETRAVLERLDEALLLIERHQPHTYHHMRRDLSGIWVKRFPCRGAYLPQYRACLTELTFLARRDISAAIVASSILHESIHARVDCWRRRFGATRDDAQAAREERLCRKAELAFGKSLPEDLGKPVIDRALSTLALDDDAVAPTIDWELARARQDGADAEAAGVPNALTKRQRAILERHRPRGE